MRRRERAGSQPLCRYYAIAKRRCAVPETRARAATPLEHPDVERVGLTCDELRVALIRSRPVTTAAVEVPVINGQHAVERHPPAIVAPVEELPLAALWHRQPACEVDKEEVARAALCRWCATPVKVDVRHDGGVADWQFWRGLPRQESER